MKQRRDAERQRIEAYEATLRRVFVAPRAAPDFENAIDEVKRGFVNDIVRPSHEWRPKLKTRDPGRLRLAAARHLFARYAVPAHLERIWIEPGGLDPAEATLRKGWYVAAARGDSLYKAGASEWLSRKEVHAVLCARGDLRFEEAFWLAIAQGMTEDPALALRIARSRIAATPRAELGFWREAARFFCANPAGREEIDDLCDYIVAARERDRRFSLKGRTLASLRRLSAEWHRDVAAVARIEAMRRRLAGPQAASETRWAGSRLQNWSWQPPGKEARARREEFVMVQLTSAEDSLPKAARCTTVCGPMRASASPVMPPSGRCGGRRAGTPRGCSPSSSTATIAPCRSAASATGWPRRTRRRCSTAGHRPGACRCEKAPRGANAARVIPPP